MFGNHRLACLLLILFWNTASAGVVDSGEIHFRGIVKDNAPRWTWQIATPAQYWDINIEDGVIDSQGNQVFNLNHKGTLSFLEGHLKDVATQGGSGMIPVISLSSSGQPLQRLAGGSTSAQSYQTSVPVFNADSGEIVGQLNFVFEQGLVVARGRETRLPAFDQLDHHMVLVAGNTVQAPHPATLSPSLAARLSELIASNSGRSVIGIPTLASRVVSQSLLSNPHVRNIAAAYASQLSEFTLQWSQDKVPTRWKATLNVTVQVL